MKFKNIILSLILASGIIFAQDKNSSDKITWHVINWPPFMSIKDGKKSGEYAQLLNLINEELPQYEHHHKLMSWARVWHEIKYKRNTCNIFAFKNKEREKFATFSVPFSIFSSNHIIMKKEKAELLGIDNTKPYSFNKFLELTTIKGILDKSRSYSSKIDTILKNKQAKSNFKQEPFTAERLLTLLDMGRIDYILEYPSVVNNLKKKNELKGEFVFIQIKEIDPFTWGYIACPKNKWGEKLIGHLNQIILDNKEKKEYRKIIEMMTSSDRELALLRKIYPEFVNARK